MRNEKKMKRTYRLGTGGGGRYRLKGIDELIADAAANR